MNDRLAATSVHEVDFALSWHRYDWLGLFGTARGHKRTVAEVRSQAGDQCRTESGLSNEQVFAGHGIVILRRVGDLFVQYDGGALVPKWLEASISEAEAEALKANEQSAYKMLLQREGRSRPAT